MLIHVFFKADSLKMFTLKQPSNTSGKLRTVVVSSYHFGLFELRKGLFNTLFAGVED